MTIRYPDLTGQKGTKTAAGYDLDGAAISGAGQITLRTFGEAVTDGDLSDGAQVYCTVYKNATNWATILATFNDLATDTLSSVTVLASDGTISNTDTVDIRVTDEKNYNKFGTVFPVAADFPGGAIPDGATFYHQTRNVDYLYDDLTWKPRQAFDALSLYVDDNDSGDGWGSGTDAAAAIQTVVDEIPGLFSNDITIDIEAGTYAAEVTIRGKNATADAGITLQGKLSTTTEASTAGTTGDRLAPASDSDKTSWASITDSGIGWTTDIHQFKLAKDATNDIYLPIYANDTDTLYLSGALTSTPSGNYTIATLTTEISGDVYLYPPAGNSITFEQIKFTGTGKIYCRGAGNITFNNCYFEVGVASKITIQGGGPVTVTLNECVAVCTGDYRPIFLAGFSVLEINRSYFDGDGNTSGADAVYIRQGVVSIDCLRIDDFDIGLFAEMNAVYDCYPGSTSTGNGPNSIYNCNTGVQVKTGGIATNVSNSAHVFFASTVTTNVNEETGKYSAIGEVGTGYAEDA